VPAKKKQPVAAAGRDPDRTRRRILDAALKEFSARGFAGARVGGIARRAKANKRMLYHYFDDKEGLFRAVLRHKISERRSRVEAQVPQTGQVSSMPLWFQQNCQDIDWVRLLAWESLQTTKATVLDETERRRVSRQAVARIQQKQAAGRLRRDVAAAHLQLAKVSLAMFPLALPQITRLIVGCAPHAAKFQREYARFLETISVGFRPQPGGVKIKSLQPRRT
jgi:AcrR family transcriptional regulator